MKRKVFFTFRTHLFLSLLTAAVFLSQFVIAQQYSYNDSWGQRGLNLEKESKQGVNIIYSVDKFTIEDFELKGEAMKNVVLPGSFVPADAGAPNLPGNGRYIAIPQGAKAKINIVSKRVEKIRDVSIAPAPVLPLENDDNPLVYEKDMKIYSKNEFYPAEPIKISEPTKIRGVDVVMLGITPFQYNPVTKELLVYRDLELEIVFEGGNGVFGEERLRSRWFDPILFDAVLNYQSLPEIDYNEKVLNGSREEGCEYLIVSPDGEDFQKWADSIRIFRIKQGITTKVVTLDEIGGNNVNVLENYFNNAYNNWDQPPAAVLLLGDYGSDQSNSITSPIYNDYCVSDNIFADVDGDHMPEMVFARITARNASELEVMITKFLNHERNPPENEDFYDHPVTAMGWQTERWFQICSETINGFFEFALGKEPVRENAIYSGSPGSTWSTAQNTSTVVDYFGPNGLGYIPADPSHLTDWGGNATRLNNDINSGCFMIQHRDHGSETGWGEPDYDINDIDGCMNTDLTFIMSINCLTGKYNWSSECFTEKFHRYTNDGENSGALGLIAASEVSYSFVNDTYVWGVYDNMWTDFMPDYGTTPASRGLKPAFGHAAGKYFLKQSSWPYNTNNKAVTYNLFHHHGGAFLTLYSEMPEELTVNHAGIILGMLEYFTITVDEGAFVALTVGDQIIGTGVGTGSQINIPIIPQTPGTQVDLVITKRNHYRHMETLPVISPEGPYVVYASHQFNDSTGNGNSAVDYGENIFLSLTLENLGNDPGIDIETTINTMSDQITLNDSEEIYDSIPANNTATEEDGFEFNVAEIVPDMTKVKIDVESTDGDSVWGSQFEFYIHAPILNANDMSIIDTSGNNNGRIDPGEEVTVRIALNNTGHCPAANAIGTLDVNCPYILVHNDTDEVGTIQLLGTYYAEFEMYADSATPQGTLASFHFELNAEGYTAINNYDTEVGALVEDWESGDFTKFNWEFGGDADFMVSTLQAYEGDNSAVSGNISNDETTSLILTSEVSHYNDIAFYVKTSSEGGRDFARFYIDGNMKGEWSGMMDDWEHVTYNVTGGNHTFKWEFSKDDFLSMGDDCFWVDFIEFPPMPVLSAFAGHDDYGCMDSDFECQGIVTNCESMEWNTTGTGTFDDPTIINALYTPSAEDLENGHVNLILTAYDADGNEDTDKMLLTFIEEPVSPLMPEGPVWVDLLNTTTTTYTVEEVMYTDSYMWNIDPEEAGTTESTTNEAEIQWNEEFEGQVLVSAKGINECGEGEWSEPIEITVGTSVGIDDDMAETLHIYPNPSSGIFNIYIPESNSMEYQVRVFNITGTLVYENEINTAGRSMNTSINLENYPEGVYFIKLDGSDDNYTRKVIVE